MSKPFKPLPGQMPLFDLPATDADEIQRRAVQRNDQGNESQPAVCAWGNCAEPATIVHRRSGEQFCQLHAQWFLQP